MVILELPVPEVLFTPKVPIKGISVLFVLAFPVGGIMVLFVPRFPLGPWLGAPNVTNKVALLEVFPSLLAIGWV